MRNVLRLSSEDANATVRSQVESCQNHLMSDYDLPGKWNYFRVARDPDTIAEVTKRSASPV
jgi:hypothetical protein